MEKYLKQLISLPTLSSDRQANSNALNYLEQFFVAHHLHVARYTFNDVDALVATTVKDSKTPVVLLGAHLDVVPGPDFLFELREADGKYLGRGVFDMKFAIASFMEVLDVLGETVSDYDLGIMITTDEEVGGLNGVKKLVEAGYKPGVCVLPDGANNWQIETFAKGFMYGKIAVEGKAAHGSTPWDGDSATYKLVDILHDLKQRFADQTLNTNTLNISLVSGGAAKNQVPAYAEATVDIRFLSEAEHELLTTMIQGLCDKYGATYSEEPLGGHPCINELSHELIAPFAQSIETVTGVKAQGMVSFGASDARFFAGVDVPCIIARPSGGGQHADGEWIDKQGCLQYPDVLLDYIKKVARTA